MELTRDDKWRSEAEADAVLDVILALEGGATVNTMIGKDTNGVKRQTTMYEMATRRHGPGEIQSILPANLVVAPTVVAYIIGDVIVMKNSEQRLPSSLHLPTHQYKNAT